MIYCKCRIPSPSSYHEFCINMGCSKRIKTLAEKCTELEQENKLLRSALQDIEDYGDGGLEENKEIYLIAYTALRKSSLISP